MKDTFQIRGIPITIDVGDDGILIAIAGQGEIARASVFVEVDAGEVDAHIWDEAAEKRQDPPVTIAMIHGVP